MHDEQDTMINPGYEDLVQKVDSRFTLVSLAAMRAREINSYYLGLAGASEVAPPQVTSTAHKALSMAFEEIDAGKITFNRYDPDVRAAEEAARLAAEQLEAEEKEAAAAAEREAEAEARREERRGGRSRLSASRPIPSPNSSPKPKTGEDRS